jgi:hypothetical protein
VSPRAATFDDFARRHGWLLEKDALLEFYSRERLMSDEARARWVEPDLLPLPEHVAPAKAGAQLDAGLRRHDNDPVRSSSFST